MIHDRHDIAVFLSGFLVGLAVAVEVIAWRYFRQFPFHLED